DATASASQIVNLYAKRWTIEPGFRDTKDLRFGMGLSVPRIGDPQRRDRLLLLNALAILLLTLLGAAGESLGMVQLPQTQQHWRWGSRRAGLQQQIGEHRTTDHHDVAKDDCHLL